MRARTWNQAGSTVSGPEEVGFIDPGGFMGAGMSGALGGIFGQAQSHISKVQESLDGKKKKKKAEPEPVPPPPAPPPQVIRRVFKSITPWYARTWFKVGGAAALGGLAIAAIAYRR